MSFTVDTNFLVYASDRSSPYHAGSRKALDEFAQGPEIFYLFWPVIMGYLRISTHPAIFGEPLSAAGARANIEALIDRPHVRTPGEPEEFWSLFGQVTEPVVPTGNLVPDAHIAALMSGYGVTRIYSRDRDFKKFDGIKVVDPVSG